MCSIIWQHYQVMKDYSKVSEKLFWMIQSAKNVAFGHYLVFGLLDGLDIAYFDSNKCFPTFGKVTRSWRIIQKSRKCIFEWSKEPKKRFLAIFWGFGLLDRLDIAYFDSTKCFLTFGNITRSWRIIQKSTILYFWMIQRAKQVFWSFSGV